MKQLWRNLPEKFLERLKNIVPVEKQVDVLEALSQRRPSTLRANTLKITASQLQEKLKKLGVELEPVTWWENAFIVKNIPLRQLTELDLYKQGYFYVQSLSSMLPPLILDPKLGEKVLDITAAPGSKTTQMAALMENLGEIVANDNSPIRVLRMEANIRIQGVTNTRIEKGAGQTLWTKYPEYFDKTLVDVPCSMEGRMCAIDPKSFEHWSTKKIKELTERQRFLLRAAISATKPGGTIVYSTCTLAPEENEGVIDWILKKEKDAVEVEPIKSLAFIGKLSFETTSGMTSWNTREYDDHVRQTVRVLPSPTMEGFYVAKLKKIKSNIPTRLNHSKII